MEKKDDTILLLRFSSLGDLVLLTALVEALRTGLPRMKIHLVTKSRYRTLFEGDPRIARISTLGGGSAGRLAGLWRELSGVRYGILIDAHGVTRSTLLYCALRARRRLRIDKDQTRKALLLLFRRAPRRRSVTMRERYLDLARRLGIACGGAMPRLVLQPAARERARADFAAAGLCGRTVVALAPGARWPAKRWPVERFARLARLLRGKGYGIVTVGDEPEREACRVAASAAPGGLNLCGTRSVAETAAALELAGALVTNDSAPLHIAEAVGTPVVALFGPTVREFGYFPLLPASTALETELDCRPCSRNGSRPCRRERLECLEAIEPEAVAEAVARVLAAKGKVDR